MPEKQHATQSEQGEHHKTVFRALLQASGDPRCESRARLLSPTSMLVHSLCGSRVSAKLLHRTKDGTTAWQALHDSPQLIVYVAASRQVVPLPPIAITGCKMPSEIGMSANAVSKGPALIANAKLPN